MRTYWLTQPGALAYVAILAMMMAAGAWLAPQALGDTAVSVEGHPVVGQLGFDIASSIPSAATDTAPPSPKFATATPERSQPGASVADDNSASLMWALFFSGVLIGAVLIILTRAARRTRLRR